MKFKDFLNEDINKLDFDALHDLCMKEITNDDVGGLRTIAKYHSEKDNKYFIVYTGDVTIRDEDDEDGDDYEDSITFVFSAELANGKWKNVDSEFESDSEKSAINDMKRRYADAKKL